MSEQRLIPTAPEIDRHPEVRAAPAASLEGCTARAVALRGSAFGRAPQGDGKSESFSAGVGITNLDLTGWQALLDRHPHIFHGMQPGARIGLMSKDDFEPPSATMMVWEATAQAMQAKYEAFPGFDQVKIDLLFIADEATLRRIHDAATHAPFAEIKTKVRRRDILLYVVTPRQDLLNLGYGEFLESLGLVFMGTCR